MGDKKFDPQKRALFSIFTDKEQMGKLGAALGRLARELRGETGPPSYAQVRQGQADIGAVEEEVEVLGQRVEAIQAAAATQEELLRDNRDLLIAIMERISSLEETVARGQQQAQDDTEKTRWQVVAEKLDKLKAVFIAATATALYELLLGDTVWPWLKQRWFDLVKPTGVEPQPASPLTKTHTEASRSGYRPKLEIDWVSIPAGEFTMGSDKARDKDARDNETPQHRVSLPAYQISRVPVTVAQFAAFVKATGYQTTAEKQGSAWSWTGQKWEDVKGANWAHPSGPGSGTDGRIWPWGNQPPTERLCNFDMNVKDTTPVGSYPAGASPEGVLDMAGNVWEWTSTLWGEDVDEPTYGYPYDPTDGRENQDAPDEMIRVLRGGSWLFDPDSVRCAVRNWSFMDFRLDNVGFRLASPGS